MKKILFLDRDGVINVDNSYVYKIEEYEWMPEVFDALKLAKESGYEFIIVTNQSGVARGYFTEDDVLKLQRYIEDKFVEHGLNLLGYYYCPHLDGAPIAKYDKKCNCRKPAPGMILQAMKDVDVDKEKSFLIGDSVRDVEAANAAGLRGYLYKGESLLAFMRNVLAKERTYE